MNLYLLNKTMGLGKGYFLLLKQLTMNFPEVVSPPQKKKNKKIKIKLFTKYFCFSGYHKDVFLKSPENGYVTRVKIEYEEGEDSCQPVSKRRHDYKNIDSNATDLTTR